MTQDISATQMMWQPPLLRLTTSHPDVDGGKPTACFINPQHILTIEKKIVKHWKIDTKDENHPAEICTAVVITSQVVLYVAESPEEIARMRDAAMGHQTKKVKSV